MATAGDGQYSPSPTHNVRTPSSGPGHAPSTCHGDNRLEGLRILFHNLGLTEIQLRMLCRHPYAQACLHYLQQVHRHRLDLDDAFRALQQASVSSTPEQLAARYSPDTIAHVHAWDSGFTRQTYSNRGHNLSQDFEITNRPDPRSLCPTVHIDGRQLVDHHYPPASDFGSQADIHVRPSHSNPPSHYLRGVAQIPNHDDIMSIELSSRYTGERYPAAPQPCQDLPTTDSGSARTCFPVRSDEQYQQPGAHDHHEVGRHDSPPACPATRRRGSMSSSAKSVATGGSGLRIKPVNPGSSQKEKVVKTHCPKCLEAAFMMPAEFVRHMLSNHERPVEFICSHYTLVKGEKFYCGFSTWHFSYWKRHHTRYHTAFCGVEQDEDTPAPDCRSEQRDQRPVLQRGCWACCYLSHTVRDWVSHTLSKHRGCSKKSMSRSWAMRSLLSHPDIVNWWLVQVKRLQANSQCYWEFEWCEDPEDVVASGLIKGLETGFFGNKNFHRNIPSREPLAMAAMNATTHTRIRKDPIPGEQLREIRRELQVLEDLTNQELSAWDPEIEDLTIEDLVSEDFSVNPPTRSRTLKRVASSSPMGSRGPSSPRHRNSPWLEEQCSDFGHGLLTHHMEDPCASSPSGDNPPSNSDEYRLSGSWRSSFDVSP